MNWRLVKHGFLLGAILFLAWTFQTFGLVYTSVSNCAFITSLNVAMVPLAAYFITGERPRMITIAGVAVAATGLYYLTSAGGTALNLGDLLSLIGAVMFALHIVFTGRYAGIHEVMRLTFVQLLTVSLLSSASAVQTEDWRVLLEVETYSDPSILFALFVASILGTGLAIVIQTMAQEHLSSTRVALIISLEPVFAALVAFLVLNEQLPAAAGFGALLILAGILLAEMTPLNRKIDTA